MDNFTTCEGAGEIDGNSDLEKVLYKLHIAHEIAMSSNPGQVKIEDLLPKSPLWRQVEEQMHSAFWEIFREEISRDPPKLDMALNLIKDIKESLYAVMTPNLSRLKDEVEEVLDDDLLRQQAEHNTVDVQSFSTVMTRDFYRLKYEVEEVLDDNLLRLQVEHNTAEVQSYAQFVITVMKTICAPLRDEDVKNLTKLTDIVDIFRGILETLNKMKLDLMNFTLNAVTPELMANQLEYERTKFSEYIELVGGKLPITEGWINRNKENSQNLTQDEILYNAFMELLTWGNYNQVPETLTLDAPRLSIIKREYYNLILAASVTIISLSCSPSDLSTDLSFKEALKESVSILMNGITTDEGLRTMIPNLLEQIKKEANIKLTGKGKPVLSDFTVQGLEQQLMDVISPNNKIRSLVAQRINEYLKASLKASSGNGPFPLALVLFQKELEILNAKFKYLVMHNIKICGSHYTQILQA